MDVDERVLLHVTADWTVARPSPVAQWGIILPVSLNGPGNPLLAGSTRGLCGLHRSRFVPHQRARFAAVASVKRIRLLFAAECVTYNIRYTGFAVV